MAIYLLLLISLLLVWSGMIIGISFLEAPVKFRAPSLTRAVGLDVGRQVFGALGIVEVGAVLASVVLAVLAREGITSWHWGALSVIWLIVGAQRLWLWPVLREQAECIIAGKKSPITYHHVAYVGSEAVKVLLLVGISTTLLYSIQVAT